VNTSNSPVALSVNDQKLLVGDWVDTASTIALRAARELGGITVNEAPTFRADQMPYGGVKDFGNIREGPHYAVRELTEERLVVVELP
jgi:hypothetical protein